MRGRDKLLEDIDGQPMLRRQAAMARRVTDASIIVALPVHPHPRYDALNGIDVTTVAVADASEGMNASLRTAIAQLPIDSKCAMVLLADLPDLTDDDLRAVADTVTLDSDTLIWRGATDTGASGHPIIFKADLFDEIAALKGDSGGREVVALAQPYVQLVPLPDTRARNDLDTPKDWDIWRGIRQK